jgi:menaquinone-dependent protoporphyrinogen oxidase
MLAHTLSLAPEIDADLCPVRDVASLAGYDAVVLGSAVRIGAWLPEAVAFVEKYQAQLRTIPVAYFTVCMTVAEARPDPGAAQSHPAPDHLAPDDLAKRDSEVASYAAPVRALVEPLCETYFAGAIDPDRFSWLMRMVIKASHLPTGDYRDWKEVKAWATEVAEQLSGVDMERT